MWPQGCRSRGWWTGAAGPEGVLPWGWWGGADGASWGCAGAVGAHGSAVRMGCRGLSLPLRPAGGAGLRFAFMPGVVCGIRAGSSWLSAGAGVPYMSVVWRMPGVSGMGRGGRGGRRPCGAEVRLSAVGGAWCRAGRKGRQAVVAVCRRRCGCGVSACVWMVPIGLSAVVSRRVSCGCRPSGSVRFRGCQGRCLPVG